MASARSMRSCTRSACVRVTGGLAGLIVLLAAGCAPVGESVDESAPASLLTFPFATSSDDLERRVVDNADSGVANLDGSLRAASFAGWLFGASNYRIHALGAGEAGERWVIEHRPVLGGGFILVALFDENMHLLARSTTSDSAPLIYVFRRDHAEVFVGVATGCQGIGGVYRFKLTRTAGEGIAPPWGQLVWLDFGGGVNVDVAAHRGLTFAALDGARIDPRYHDATDEIKRAIEATVASNYADFDVTVMSSDSAPRPDEPHVVIYFGGTSATQLGAADGVDSSNIDPGGSAIVFVDEFAEYEVMGLTAAEMGRMIGNVASHELGHLLGLYHVFEGSDVMVEARATDAAAMAGVQTLGVAELDPCVFPTGWQNAPRLLTDTVGVCAASGASDGGR